MPKTVKCSNCEKIFTKLSRYNTKNHFCCVECHKNFRHRNIPIQSCLVCGKQTNNPKYCSKSCSATDTNHKFPKRVRLKSYCIHCGVPVTYRRTTCDSCNPSIIDWSTVTLRDLKSRYPYQKHTRIRSLARSYYKNSDKPKKCCNCGYDKHYEVCHIKPINSYNSTATVAEINSLHNLIGLCPNCHWEFDNGLLNIHEFTAV